MLFTGAPIKAEDIRIDISASSCPVLTIKTKENRWLNSWTISYYLFNLISGMIQSIPIDIQGEFGYTSIKLIAETGTKVRLLANSSIRETYFLHDTNNNLILNDVPNYGPSSESLPHLGYSMVINGKEVQAENSDDPLMISDIQSDFDSLWATGQIEKQKNNHTQAGKALGTRRKTDKS